MENANSLMARTRALYQKYEAFLPAIFFLAGFLFDIITLDRIDSWFNIAQQGVYLIILHIILTQMLIEFGTRTQLSPQWRHYIEWRIPIVHFIFGSLLSSYTLFYFKSASLASSFVFLLFMLAILVINELPKFHGLDVLLKLGLLALCSMSYCAYLIPILIGKTGTIIFLVSLIAGLLPMFMVYKIALKKGTPDAVVRSQTIRPALAILIIYLVFYVFRLIPPVPLSIQYMGIYHQVKKDAAGLFSLAHERPWWRFWHNGDQWFTAQPGDRLTVFFRLFSPTNFTDEVNVVWFLKDPTYGWAKQDQIPIKITGGREEGFRGYAAKTNYTDGQWRVVIETSDGSEIGRIGFTVQSEPTTPREFKYDVF